MNELNPTATLRQADKNSTLKFALTALISAVLSVVILTSAAYYLLRSAGLQAQLESASAALVRDLRRQVNFAQLDVSGADRPRRLIAIKQAHDVEELLIYSPAGKLVWTSGGRPELVPAELAVFHAIAAGSLKSARLVDPWFNGVGQLKQIIFNHYQVLTAFSPIFSTQGDLLAVVRTGHDFSAVLKKIRATVFVLFFIVLAGHLLVVCLLYYNFRRSIKTIAQQEERLNQQISRLSNMLTLNKSMQQNMKSASSRAVELNEQFLRRVGADLHDGPAQSIGYAVLRLAQVSKTVDSKELGQEFHAVKEALDGALTEIRGISTGLVLPELDDLTLEQSLQRVVSRHEANSDIAVKEFYADLPEHVSTPIKICAYRFVQEGLNNASRHGRAKRARVSAQVKDDVLHLSLKDDGMGFRKSKLNTEGGHLGLMGLKDRIESLGGNFTINSELGVGTAIKVSISLAEDD